MMLLRILAFKLPNIVACILMNNFRMDKRKILQRISRGLQWENKLPKLKRSITNDPDEERESNINTIYDLQCRA